MIDCDTTTGQLTAAGILLHGPAWCLTDLTALWGEVAVRGDDRPIPLADGVDANRRHITVTEHSLPFVIDGAQDQFDNPYTNPWVGLELNLKYLRDNLIDPPGTTAGTRAASLLMPSGAIRTAAIHVLDIRLGRPVPGIDGFTGQDGALFDATLEISIPLGRFT